MTSLRLSESSNDSSSGSEESDVENPYTARSGNPSFVSSSQSLTLSQSHQILMDTPVANNASPSRVVFGIARRASSHSQSYNSPQAATPSQADRVTDSCATSADRKPSLLSPPSSGNSRVDKSVELARWMGKSPVANTISNGNAHSGAKPLLLQTHNSMIDSELKIQPISRPQQPFHGLFAELKRGSTDTAPSEPMFKRVA